MKTIKIFFFIILFVGFSKISFADNTPTSNNEPSYKDLMLNEIKELIEYPDFAKQLDIQGFVLVSFKYDSQGNLIILESNSNSELLRNYVTKRLQELQMCSHAKKPEKTYNLRFDFVLM